MFVRFCIHAALSSTMTAAAVKTTPAKKGSGNEPLPEGNNNNDIDSLMAPIHSIQHVPQKILSAYDSSIDVNDKGMMQALNPFSKEMDESSTPVKTLRNVVSDAIDKPILTVAEEFNASEELGILHNTPLRNDTLISRELQSTPDCGGNYPVVQASTTYYDFYDKVISCLYYVGTEFDYCPPNLVDVQLGCWNTSLVDDMSYAFTLTEYFNEDISLWDVSAVTSMYAMFSFALGFNSPIGNWNTTNVEDMKYMFAGSVFNQPIGKWNTQRVNDMTYMFAQSQSFDRPLTKWETGSVTDMIGMFMAANSFNRPIDNWDVSSVKNMTDMFSAAPSFNQCLSTWPEKVPQNVDTSGMFSEGACYETDAVPGDGPWCCRDPCVNAPQAFPSMVSCEEVAGLSSALVDELCNLPSWGIAEKCPELCLNTDLCPCTDSILPFEDTSCEAVAGLKKKKRKKKCKNNNNVAINCPGTCTC